MATKTNVTKADLKALGLKVRGYRKAAGLSLSDVAGKSGLSRANLSRLENGVGAKSPGLSTIKRLAAAVGVQPSVLVSSLDHLPSVAHTAA